MELLLELFKRTPELAIIGGLVWVIYLLAHKDGPMQQLGSNHMTHLDEKMERLELSLARMESTLVDIRDVLNYLKGRINGRT